MDTGKLVLRLVVGGLVAGHGLQKLTGAFDGPGLQGTEQMMGNLRMLPARRNALAVAVTETAGGAALALGAATPVAAAGLIACMVTAARKVHLRNGVWNSAGGYEYNAVLAVASAAAVGDGPGRLSVDALFGRSRWGAGWMFGAIAAGVAASFAAVELGHRSAAADVAAAQSDGDADEADEARSATS